MQVHLLNGRVVATEESVKGVEHPHSERTPSIGTDLLPSCEKIMLVGPTKRSV